MADEMCRLELQIKRHPSYVHVFMCESSLREALRRPRDKIPREYKKMIERYFDLKETLQGEFYKIDATVQSGQLSSGSVNKSNETQEQNLTDIMGEPEKEISAGGSLYPNIGQSTDLSLSEFFERPVELATFDLPIGTGTHQILSIWDLFSLSPTVRAKFRNYAYFSGDLHVRIAISGSPFHRGIVLVSYQPYGPSNTNISTMVANVASSANLRPLLLNSLSQAPGALTMDVKANKPAVIDCPFISPKPAFRLYNSSSTAISAVTSYDDFENAGDLHIITVNDPQSTGVVDSTIEVKVYCWATNVQLGTSTGTQVAITTESKVNEKDERETGPIEKVTTAAADVAGLVSEVPIVAPYVKASETVFRGAASLASIFGWSRPPVISPPSIVKNYALQNGSVTIGSETTKRITYDPKQEINVDPRICGTDVDDMKIAEIAKRWSYLTTFDWLATSASMIPLWRCKVHPTLATYATGTVHTFVQPTAAMFAVQPHSFWNCRMVYRIQAATSMYHRGKYAVFYEPNISQQSIIESNLTTNRQFMTVIDIQETQTVDICVSWARPRYWAVTEQNFIESYGSDFTTNRPTYSNGYIIIVPFTALQSNDNSDIELNVYVRALDLRVNYLSNRSFPAKRELEPEVLNAFAPEEEADKVVEVTVQSKENDRHPLFLNNSQEGLLDYYHRVYDSPMWADQGDKWMYGKPKVENYSYEDKLLKYESAIERKSRKISDYEFEPKAEQMKADKALGNCSSMSEINDLLCSRVYPVETTSQSAEVESLSSEEVSCFDINDSKADMSKASSYHFGEECLSFRSHLKRYIISATYGVNTPTSFPSRIDIVDRNFPVNPLPYGASGVNGSMNIFGYLSYAFLGAKGGLRKRLHVYGAWDNDHMSQIKISNNLIATAITPSASVVASPARASINGTVTFVPGTNGGIEYELPYYSNNMWWFSFADDMVGTNNTDESVTFWNKGHTVSIDVTTDPTQLDFALETASGEDFTLMRFQTSPYFTL